jgi:hypothetical protein
MSFPWVCVWASNKRIIDPLAGVAVHLRDDFIAKYGSIGLGLTTYTKTNTQKIKRVGSHSNIRKMCLHHRALVVISMTLGLFWWGVGELHFIIYLFIIFFQR